MTTTWPAWGPRPGTVEAVFDRPGSMRGLAVLRLALGVVVIGHLAPFLADSVRGISYQDRFWEPWWGFVPTVPPVVQVVLVWTGAAAAIGLSLGWRTRWVASLTWVCVAGNLFLSQTHFRHNRAFLVILLGIVALSDSGRVLSLDARRRRCRDDRATVWPLWVGRAVAATVYLASGFSKLIDTDWSGGLVLWDRSVRYQSFVRDSVLPDSVADVVVEIVTTRWVHAITSPIAVAMELFIGLGLWFGPTRLAAIWTAIFFHLSIELSAAVEIFSLAALVALVLWVTPVTGDRTVWAEPRLARRIRALDWLGRFDVVDAEGAMRVQDRDGTTRVGTDAKRLVRTRLPLLFPVALPVAAVERGVDRLRR